MFFSAQSVLLTTAERADYFLSVLGDAVDVRLDPAQTAPFDSFLCALSALGSITVIVDEAHFFDTGEMLGGIERFLDNPEMCESDVEFVVVCAQRQPGDWILSRLAGYCGIYNLLYDCPGAEVTERLACLQRRRNTRFDVIEVLRSPFE